MLILEGADGVGKSTLAKKLVKRLERFRAIYAHFTRLPDSFHRVWGYVDRMSPWVVQDRFHMSELAYAYACGRWSSLTPEWYRVVDAYLRKIGVVTVVIEASPELVRSRWDASQMFDIDTTARAALAYQMIGSGEFALDGSGVYQVDIDYTIILSERQPYADDALVDRIADLYINRQMGIDALAAARPSRL